MSGKPFFDTNVLIYAFSTDVRRSERARALLSRGGIIGVQSLNEFVLVATRKLIMSWDEIDEAINAICKLCPDPVPLTFETHRRGVDIARRYRFRIYDSLIIAAAIESGCSTLYSEDLQDGQVIDDLVVTNPFSGADRPI